MLAIVLRGSSSLRSGSHLRMTGAEFVESMH